MKASALRPLAVLLSALAVVGVLVLLASGGGSNDQNNPSSRSAGKLGSLALYTWFQDLGLQVHRISGSFDLGGTDVLVMYDPTVDVTSTDVDSVMSLVKSGGDVVLVTDLSTVDFAQPLLAAINLQVERPVSAGVAVPAQPFDATGRVRSIPVAAGYAFEQLPPAIPLLESGGDAVASVLRVGGGGRVYVLGDAQPLSNDGLRHDDSEFFALSLLQRARGGRVAFDEYHHGEGGQVAEGAGAIFNGPIGVAAGIAAAILLAATALNGRRLGKPVPAGDPARVPSATTYVSALGQLFARSRMRGPIAARYADELTRFAAARTGVDSHLDDASVVAALRAAGVASAGEVELLLDRLRRLAAGNPTERELLDAARDVDSLERDWVSGQLRP